MRSLRALRISVVTLMAAAVLMAGGLQVGSQTEQEELPPFIVTVSFPDDAVAFVDLLPGGTTRVTKVRVARGPIGVGVHPDRLFTYVVSWTAKALTVLDNAQRAGVWAGTFGGNLYAVAFRHDGDVAYITDAERKRIIVLDTRDPANPQLLTYIALPGARAPRNLAFTPDGRWAFVSDSESGRVQMIDAQAHRRVRAVETGGRCAIGVEVSHFGRWLYVADRCTSGGTVYAVEIASLEAGAPQITPIPLSAGRGAWFIAFSPDDSFAYVSQTEPRQDVSSGQIAIIDTDEKRQIGEIETGGFPAGLQVAWTDQGLLLFVFNPQASIQRVLLDSFTGYEKVLLLGLKSEAIGPPPSVELGLAKALNGVVVPPALGSSQDAEIDKKRIRELINQLNETRKKWIDARNALEANPLIQEIRLVGAFVDLATGRRQLDSTALGALQAFINCDKGALAKLPEKAFEGAMLLLEGAIKLISLDARAGSPQRAALDQLAKIVEETRKQGKDAIDKLKRAIDDIGTIPLTLATDLKEALTDFLTEAIEKGVKKAVKQLLTALVGARAAPLLSIPVDLYYFVDAVRKIFRIGDLLQLWNQLWLELIKQADQASLGIKAGQDVHRDGVMVANGLGEGTITMTARMMCWRPKENGEPGEGEWEETDIVMHFGGEDGESIEISTDDLWPSPHEGWRVIDGSFDIPKHKGPCYLVADLEFKRDGKIVATGTILIAVSNLE